MKSFAKLFLLIALPLAFSGCTPKKEASESNGPKLELLIGTYTGNGSEGIYRMDFDVYTGSLTSKELIAKTSNPSYLTISKDRSKVFAVNENEEGTVSSFIWNANRTQLELVSHQPSDGSAPCYAELSPRENLFATANYSTGNIAIYQVDQEGAIQPAPEVKQHTGSGPTPNQQSPHAHCTKFSPDGRFLYAVDLGNDKVLAYPVLNNQIGEEITALELDPGDGPRHLIFHPTKNIAFIVNEISSTVVSASIDTQTGEFTRISKAETLPKTYKGQNACADVHISGDGRYLYASNRGHNSLAIFKVFEDGKLDLITTESVHGDWPRNFTLSPNEQFVLVANQKSNDITIFKRDPDSGLLDFTGEKVEIDQPVCLKF